MTEVFSKNCRSLVWWIVLLLPYVVLVIHVNEQKNNGTQCALQHVQQENSIVNSDSVGVHTRGPPSHDPKNIISFSLYNAQNPRYGSGALRNADLVNTVFPGWTMRVYHNETVQTSLLTALKEKHVELINLTATNLINPMTWRFSVASDATVDRYIIRDIDSRLLHRDKHAVDEWVRSTKRFHILRDHPAHSDFAMNGGLWGGTRDAVPNMVSMLEQSQNEYDAGYRQDMNFLDMKVWPVAQQSMLQHDAFSCLRYAGASSFPSVREGTEHVGQVFLSLKDKTRRADTKALSAATQPHACKDRNL